MKIGELAQQVGLTRDTLRFYEKIGLFKPHRSSSGIRDYCDEDIDRLRVIICFKDSGIPLEDIKQYLVLVDQGPGNEEERLAILTKSKKRLQETLEKLKKTMDLLDYKISHYEEIENKCKI